MFEKYVEYFKNFVNENKIEPQNILIDDLNEILKKGESDSTIESLNIIHMNLYRKRGYKFLDYFNYRRCIEYNLPLNNF